MKKIYTVLLICFVGYSFGQTNGGEDFYDDSPGIAVGYGFSFYKGNYFSTDEDGDIKSSTGNFHIEYFHPVTHELVLKGGFAKNNFNYWDINPATPVNVKTGMSSFNLSANYKFDNGKVIKRKLGFSPYVGIGVGYLSLNSKADYLSGSGAEYHYWSDGTIRSVEENSTLSAEADTVYRDYNYETNYTDSLHAKTGLLAFFEVGLGMKITPNVSGVISYKKSMLLNDYMKGVSDVSSNDQYGYFSVGLAVNFGGLKKTDEEKEVIEQSDAFEGLDEDKDGVSDLYDKCAHSSTKAKVDKVGCPLDSDKDGVADYMDVEPKSPNSDVNEQGKSYTEEELEVIYLLRSGKMSGHEKYNEFKKKYSYLFEKFTKGGEAEKIEHKTEGGSELDGSLIDIKTED